MINIKSFKLTTINLFFLFTICLALYFLYVYVGEPYTNSGKCKLPVFQPEKWNDGKEPQKNNNCYAYAFRDLVPDRTNRKGVGEEAGLPKIEGEKYTCPTFENNMKIEHPDVVKSSKDAQCPCGSYKISLFLDTNEKSKDFHFYRQDNNDTWSHKIGGLPATNLDATGNIIMDPGTSDRNYKEFDKNYDETCGYYCVPYKNNTLLD